MALTLSGLDAAAATATANSQPSSPQEVPPTPSEPQAEVPIYIKEFRVDGAKLLKPAEIEEAVYPYLGPGRTSVDVERAKDALEKVYREKGYQTVSVSVPSQSGRRGIIVLQVTEAKVGRLRVHGSRYFSLDEIKRRAPSMAEGTVPNFNDVTRDVVALNQLSDRRVSPELRAGVEPGTVDIDLNVKDTLPMHGSLELNNRYSADTTELRLSGSWSYDNLWQQGHSLGLSFQIAPQKISDAEIYSAFYTVRFPTVPWLTFTLKGRKQDSNITTLGGTSVVSPGESIGGSLGILLPGTETFFHSLQFGMDYNHYREELVVAGVSSTTPISYYPFNLTYSATLVSDPKAELKRTTELEASLNFHFRGMGSSQEQFENKRFGADGSYVYLRGDLSHTQDLPLGAQLYGKVQGQISNQPLINSEQYSGGGTGTVRGYLESSELGDNGFFGTIEFRTPSLLGWMKDPNSEWRLHAFFDGGFLTLNKPLPEQQGRFEFSSYGFGSRIKLFDHFNGSIDVGIPLTSLENFPEGDAFVSFRVWADF